jgi:hypothetical protein
VEGWGSNDDPSRRKINTYKMVKALLRDEFEAKSKPKNVSLFFYTLYRDSKSIIISQSDVIYTSRTFQGI